MNSIAEIQAEIVSDFQEIGDSFDQYAYLIELSCALPPMAEEAKTPERLVEGCQSRVWLDIRCKDGIFDFQADSDTLIVRGVLYLLERLFNGQPCQDVARTKILVLRETAIMNTFASERQKGLDYVIRTLQSVARENERKTQQG